MAAQVPQSFENHARFRPGYHFVALPLLAVNFFYAAYQAAVQFSTATAIGLMLAVTLVMVAIFSRTMTLTVQDRVIRLEERLRMRALLPADLQGRIEEFTVRQLVALRFASDEELPVLARKVLDGKIENQKEIKKMVTRWRADYLRA